MFFGVNTGSNFYMADLVRVETGWLLKLNGNS